jgi:hypothetical protein
VGATAQSNYVPPPASAALVSDFPFKSALAADAKFHTRFIECDRRDTCDGRPLLANKCNTDPNRNTAFLNLPGDILFFDAKMAVDADGSELSKENPGKTDQPATSLRYPLPGKPSIDADKVPYIVLPGADFEKPLSVELGDIALVVYKDHLAFAIVGDHGPKCKLGEGSIQLHEMLGQRGCVKRDTKGICLIPANSGVAKDVLYFVFRGSRARIFPGLTPENILERVVTQGQKLMDGLKSNGTKPVDAVH